MIHSKSKTDGLDPHLYSSGFCMLEELPTQACRKILIFKFLNKEKLPPTQKSQSKILTGTLKAGVLVQGNPTNKTEAGGKLSDHFSHCLELEVKSPPGLLSYL